LGAIGLFIFLFAFIFLAVAQIRHAVWNSGAMLEPEQNNMLSYVMLGLSVVVALVLTLVILGAVS